MDLEGDGAMATKCREWRKNPPTRCILWHLKCAKFHFCRGLRPGPQ